MHPNRKTLIQIASAVAIGATALLGAPAQANTASQCPGTAFTPENYDRVTEGMSVKDISQLLGCEPAAHLTFRSDKGISMSWSTIGAPLRYIQVWFDIKGQSVQRLSPGFAFKTSTGF